MQQNIPILKDAIDDKIDSTEALNTLSERIGLLQQVANEAKPKAKFTNASSGNTNAPTEPREKYRGARNGDESDIVPGYTIAQYAKWHKGCPKYGHLWNVHDPKWWAKKMKEAEIEKRAKDEAKALGIETVDFKNCQAVYFNSTKYFETRFGDDTKVPAIAHDTDEYRKTASELGYGDNLDLLCLHHEVAHTVMSEAEGKPNSPTLWAVAHPEDSNNISVEEQYEEESRVLAFQKWFMTGELDDKLRGLNLDKIGETFASVINRLRSQPLDTQKPETGQP